MNFEYFLSGEQVNMKCENFVTNHNFVLTHNDLDALGSVICFNESNPITYLERTNYADLPLKANVLLEKARELQKLCKNTEGDTFNTFTTTLVIMDVSFSQHRELLEKLCQHFDRVQLIDHHMYPDDFFDNLEYEYSNLDITVDQGECASRLVYKSVDGLHMFLNILTRIINDYDMWNTSSDNFENALWLNEFYKEQVQKGLTFREILDVFRDNLRDIVTFNYSIKTLKEKTLSRASEIMLNDVLYKRVNDVTLLNTEDCFQYFVYNEMKCDQNVVIARCNNRVKIRIKPDVFTDESLDEFREALTGSVNFGHPLAFSVADNPENKVHFSDLLEKKVGILKYK